MALPNLHAGYFSIENPIAIVDRWCNRYCHRARVRIDGRLVEVRWTRRAQRALDAAASPLVVEMQLYFSCVVKKRVLFHDSPVSDAVAVNSRFAVIFRPIASAACDPVEFAARHPQARVLQRDGARAMLPRRLEIDFRRGRWQGQFGYQPA